MRLPLCLPRDGMPFPWLLAFSIFITASGCYFGPMQMPDEKPFKDERLTFIEIGTTTKEQVDAAMSNFKVYTDEGEETAVLTPHEFRGGDWWLYARRREQFTFLVWPETEGDPFKPAFDYQFLLIKFDDEGVVSGYEVSSLEDTDTDGCNVAGICRITDEHYMLLASDEEDQAVKSLQPYANQCIAYLYIKIPYNWTPFRVSFDDDPGIVVAGQFAYLYWVADLGLHEINFVDPVLNEAILTKRIDCQGSGPLYLEYRLKRDGYRLESIKPSKGRLRIKKRRLVLMN